MNNNEEPNPNAQAGPEELPDNEPAPEAEAEEPEEVPENPTPFALNPGQAHLKLLDYRTREGVKYYQCTTAALYKESHFDVEADQLNDFLKMLEEHAKEFGWIDDDIGGILNIPIDLENILERDFKNVVTNFGECTLQEIRLWEETYINGTSCGAQDTHMLYKCLLSTMSEEGHAKTTVWKSEYHVGTRPSGVLLLKVMIRESHIDTNAMASSIRHQMANLKDYIIKVNCDIRVFNRHVQSLIEGLSSRGQQSTDLLVNLFATYKVAKDKKFIKYIEDKESAHEEGADITVPALLKYASNKYKILYEKGEWCAPSEEEKHILALNAKITSLEKQVGKTKTSSSSSSSKKKNHKQGSTKECSPRPKWLADHVKPSADALKKPKMWNGTKYYWCHADTGGQCPGNWRVHKPGDCKFKAIQQKKREVTGNSPNQEGTTLKHKKLKLNKAMKGLATHSDSEDSE